MLYSISTDESHIEINDGNGLSSTDLFPTLLERLSDFRVFLSIFSLYSRHLSSAKNIPASNLGYLISLFSFQDQILVIQRSETPASVFLVNSFSWETFRS